MPFGFVHVYLCLSVNGGSQFYDCISTTSCFSKDQMFVQLPQSFAKRLKPNLTNVLCISMRLSSNLDLVFRHHFEPRRILTKMQANRVLTNSMSWRPYRYRRAATTSSKWVWGKSMSLRWLMTVLSATETVLSLNPAPSIQRQRKEESAGRVPFWES